MKTIRFDRSHDRDVNAVSLIMAFASVVILVGLYLTRGSA